jgi:AcrR family transcriptional regulator
VSQALRRTKAPPAARRRTRRRADEARDAILDAAERRLVAGGPEAIRVQTIARDIGLTDPAVHYHFGSRDGLIEALMRRAGRRLKERIARAVRKWEAGSFDVATLIDLIGETYGERGYARLAAWMALAHWRPRGSGLYRELTEAIHAARARRAAAAGAPAPELEDTQLAVALLNLVLFAEPLVGGAMRSSVGLAAGRTAARRHRRWLAALLDRHLRPGTGH